MKRSMFFVVLFACMFASAHAVKSQTATRATSEQSLQELVTEVRQLRATLQRMNVAVYKGQVLLERLKLQQEQVTLISRELTEVQETIYDIRGQRSRVREQMKRTKEAVDVGSRNVNDLAAVRIELEELNQREERLTARATRLQNELNVANTSLADLNHQLNVLVEVEMK